MEKELDIARVLAVTGHRPWELPAGPWVGTMVWHDLLFAHWPVPHAALQPLVPASLPLDSFDGHCWVGVIPFRMSDVRPRGLRIPGLSAFPEINVRTYVTVQGKPGVYFFSLDVPRALAVLGARALFKLPYFRARMEVRTSGEDQVSYFSERRAGPRPARFRAGYGPVSTELMRWQKESLAHFLTERYCLYTTGRNGGVYRCNIHHPPWPLQEARAAIAENTMAAACGITLPAREPVLHFAKLLRVLVWPLQKVRG